MRTLEILEYGTFCTDHLQYIVLAASNHENRHSKSSMTMEGGGGSLRYMIANGAEEYTRIWLSSRWSLVSRAPDILFDRRKF